MKELTKEFFAAGTLSVARKLLGTEISHNECRGIIVETEAYKTDEASHYNTRRHKAKVLIETWKPDPSNYPPELWESLQKLLKAT